MSAAAKFRAFVRNGANKADQVVAAHDSSDQHTAGAVRVAVGEVLREDGIHGLEKPHQKKNKYTRLGLIGAAVGIVAGLLGTGLGATLYATAADTDAEATGQVSYVGQREYSRSSSSSRRRGSSSTDKGCRATATFTVGGTAYLAASDGAQQDLCDYTVGESIDVHYVSGNPNENYIGTSPKSGPKWLIGVGLLIALGFSSLASARLTSIAHGTAMARTGRQMMNAHPRTQDTAAAVAAAKAAITDLLRGTDDDDDDDEIAAHVPVAPHAPAAPPAVSPGWYATADGAHERWHDGTRWTDHTRQTGAPV